MGQSSFNTSGLKIGSSQNLSHIHSNGQAQTNQSHIHSNGQAETNQINGHPQIIIGHSEHALNSEHALRESK